MHVDLNSLIGFAALALGGWLAKKIHTPRDHERAAALDAIARGAAALVVSLNPGKKWADLLSLVVDSISSAAGVPTKNRDAIQRAAAHALNSLNVPQ